jgi:hypothetical protein
MTMHHDSTFCTAKNCPVQVHCDGHVDNNVFHGEENWISTCDFSPSLKDGKCDRFEKKFKRSDKKPFIQEYMEEIVRGEKK